MWPFDEHLAIVINMLLIFGSGLILFVVLVLSGRNRLAIEVFIGFMVAGAAFVFFEEEIHTAIFKSVVIYTLIRIFISSMRPLQKDMMRQSHLLSGKKRVETTSLRRLKPRNDDSLPS